MSRRAQRALSALAFALACASGLAVPSEASTPRREGPSRCLRACRACEAGARDRASLEACWSASATCCEAGGRRPVLRACGCW